MAVFSKLRNSWRIEVNEEEAEICAEALGRDLFPDIDKSGGDWRARPWAPRPKAQENNQKQRNKGLRLGMEAAERLAKEYRKNGMRKIPGSKKP